MGGCRVTNDEAASAFERSVLHGEASVFNVGIGSAGMLKSQKISIEDTSTLPGTWLFIAFSGLSRPQKTLTGAGL